jgi:hypothetical protein
MFTPSGEISFEIHLSEPERFKIRTAKVVIFRTLANVFALISITVYTTFSIIIKKSILRVTP